MTAPCQPPESHFIDGAYAEDRAGEGFAVLSPASGAKVARRHAATPAMIDRALGAAEGLKHVAMELGGKAPLIVFDDEDIGQLRAGTTWINTYSLTPVEMPFSGVKASGVGRENCRAAIEHYSQLKPVYVALGQTEAPY